LTAFVNASYSILQWQSYSGLFAHFMVYTQRSESKQLQNSSSSKKTTAVHGTCWDNAYGAIILTKSVPAHRMDGEQPKVAADPQTTPTHYHLHPPLSFIINQP